MNYGHYGRELLLELKRSDGALPPYNTEVVASALQDWQLHIRELQDQVSKTDTSRGGKPSMEVRPSILLQNAAVQRNKRCLLAYHRARMQRIQHNYWTQQSVRTMSPAEEEFSESYASLIAQYTENCSLLSDSLRAAAVPPPSLDDRVLVRVVKAPTDTAVVLESGTTVVWTVGSTQYSLYSDVEEWVRSGHLKLLEGEESSR